MSSKAVYSRWVAGKLVFYTAAGTEICRIDGTAGVFGQVGVERTLRTRVTLAQINAGFTLLAVLTGYKYRMTDVTVIAVGGAAAGLTSVDISATQGAATVILASYAAAALTQSTVLKPNTANVTILADGASFATNDVSTAITIKKVGSDLTTATNIDVIMTYAIEV